MNILTYVCSGLGITTKDIHIAVGLSSKGRIVEIYKDDVLIGTLIYKGEIKKVSDFPKDSIAGTVYLCYEDGGFHLKERDGTFVSVYKTA